MSPGSDAPDRRSGTAPRIPLVRRCVLSWRGGRSVSAFIVNISAEGAYLTRDDFAPRPPGGRDADRPGGGSTPAEGEELPGLEETVSCRFTLPGNDTEVDLTGTVSWLNSRQLHPVHSLPPGFGLRFDRVRPADRARIEALVAARTSDAR